MISEATAAMEGGDVRVVAEEDGMHISFLVAREAILDFLQIEGRYRVDELLMDNWEEFLPRIERARQIHGPGLEVITEEMIR